MNLINNLSLENLTTRQIVELTVEHLQTITRLLLKKYSQEEDNDMFDAATVLNKSAIDIQISYFVRRARK